MITFILLLLLNHYVVIGPGALSRADPGVLERVAHVRRTYGFGLDADVRLGDYDVLIAPASCRLLGRPGLLVTGAGRVYTALPVDCEDGEQRGYMARNGLLADVNEPGLVYERAVFVTVRE